MQSNHQGARAPEILTNETQDPTTYAGTGYPTHQQAVLACVSDFLTAAGNNSADDVAEFFNESTDAELLQDMSANGWTFPAGTTRKQALEALAIIRRKFARPSLDRLLVLEHLGTKETERGTACVLRINGRRCLCFPGAVENDQADYPTAAWPDDVIDPFPPALPEGPNLPGWLMGGFSTGRAGEIAAWLDLDAPPIAEGALARCLAACFDPAGKMREPHAAELAEIVSDYRWLSGPRHWPPRLVLEAVLAHKQQTRSNDDEGS